MSENKTDSFLNRIMYCSFLIILTVLGFYALQFSKGLSNDHQRWGEFGSFFGGVLGPVLSLVSILAIIKTVGMQIRALEKQTHEDHSIRWLEELFNCLSILMKIASSLIDFEGLILETEESDRVTEEEAIKNRISNKEKINMRVTKARDLSSTVLRLSRLSLNKDEEKEVRTMLAFIDHLLDIVENNETHEYAFRELSSRKHPLYNREKGNPPSDKELEDYYDNLVLFVDYYNLEKIAPWFDEVVQMVLIKISSSANPVGFFESEEFLSFQKTRIDNVIGYSID